MDRLTHTDFSNLSLTEIEARTGIKAPGGGGAAEEADYRERAWESYKQDVANRDEWGGNEGESIPPDA